MKTFRSAIPWGSTMSPATFGVRPAADRLPVVHTVGGAALCVEIINADKDGGAGDRDQRDRPGDAFQFGGVSQIVPTLVGHIHRENSGKAGGTGT